MPRNLTVDEQVRLREAIWDTNTWAHFGMWPYITQDILISLYWDRTDGQIIGIRRDEGPLYGTVSELGTAASMEDAIQFCALWLSLHRHH